MNPRTIPPVYYTIANKPEEVKELLLKEGFNPNFLNSIEDLYQSSLEYIKQDGEKAINKMTLLHPDLEWILNKFNKVNKGVSNTESSYLPSNGKFSVYRILNESEIKSKLMDLEEKILLEKDQENRDLIQRKIDELADELRYRNISNSNQQVMSKFKLEVVLAIVIVLLIVLILK